MKIVLFVHSIVSDWNNGHAHFLRGLVTALQERGHQVTCCEPAKNWSTDHLLATAHAEPILRFARRFPRIDVQFHHPHENPIEQIEELTAGADAVIVYEFNEPDIVGAAGYVRRRRKDFLLLFHDTHHRLASIPHQIVRLNLCDYDGILAFGESLARIYRTKLGFPNVHVFHEGGDSPQVGAAGLRCIAPAGPRAPGRNRMGGPVQLLTNRPPSTCRVWPVM